MPMYSQFLFHDYVINPAVVGTKDYYDVKMTQRLQWVGVDDAPRTLVLSGQGPLKNRKMGIGAYFVNDRAGHIYQQSGFLSYSYIAKLSGGVNISFGLSAGVTGWTLDGSKLNMNETGDQVLSNQTQSAYVPDGSFGIMLYSKRLTLGFSVNQIFGSRLEFFDEGNVGEAKLQPHSNFHVSYLLGSDDAEFSFTPYLLVKVVSPTPAQIDIGMKAEFKKRVWLGAAYRTDEAVSILLGILFRDNISFGYSYDVITSDISVQGKTTHEILLGIKLHRALPKKQ